VLLSPGPRKLALTFHVVSSIGWVGAVAAFLALALTGRNTADAELARSSYRAMEVLVRSVIVPMALMTLLTGVIQALGTRWGLVRHYWVVIKLVITVIATLVLLTELEPISHLADLARLGQLEAGAQGTQRTSLVLHSGGGLVALIIPTVLSIYKPPGRTRWGRAEPLT
jgi:uncharacterized membrane protein